MELYDEDNAIRFIRENVSPQIASAYDNDEFVNIIDMIMDWYDRNGMLDLNIEDEDDEVDIDELVGYVTRLLKKDRDAKMRPEHVKEVVEAEIAYEESIAKF